MMTVFRLLESENKKEDLEKAIKNLLASKEDSQVFFANHINFFSIPGAPFAYWLNESMRQAYKDMPNLGCQNYKIKVGLQTSDDFRYLRTWWDTSNTARDWIGFAKGGEYSPYYSDIHLVINWRKAQRELWAIINPNIEKPKSNIWMLQEAINNFFLRPGITWPRRTKSKLSMRFLPAGCIFADKGPAIFSDENDYDKLAGLLAICTSKAFHRLLEAQLAAADAKASGAAHSFEAGVIQKTPVPELRESDKTALAKLAREAWSLKRTLDTVNENSHAFLLPEALRRRLGGFNPQAIADHLMCIQDEINWRCFSLYGFAPEDQKAAMQQSGNNQVVTLTEGNDKDEAKAATIDLIDGLLSWAVGIAFGRFDIQLATGHRSLPTEPEPFDPLPEKSPGMLQDGYAPFFQYNGILLNEAGNKHDLPTLVELVLIKSEAPVDLDIRKWLNKEFFALHLKQYSKSRRQAPIYWPLQTPSGSYTLWIYYHRLTEQTLYTCVNDFVEPKLKSINDDLTALRSKTNRSSQEEKELERLTDFAAELKDYRDELLRIAKFWKPNLNDGVQITAAPLWKLFQHKAWQKKLKDTWQKLEHGDYDWAHLAYSIWPERVLRKCHQDRSLAIAHDVENDFWQEVEVPVKRGKKTTGATKLEWRPIELSESELTALFQQKIAEAK